MSKSTTSDLSIEDKLITMLDIIDTNLKLQGTWITSIQHKLNTLLEEIYKDAMQEEGSDTFE